MAISWFLYINLENKTQRVGFFAKTYKTKHTIDGSLLLQDRQKVSMSVLFQNVCLGWKLSPIINRWRGEEEMRVGIRMSSVEKKRKMNYSGGGRGGFDVYEALKNRYQISS